MIPFAPSPWGLFNETATQQLTILESFVHEKDDPSFSVYFFLVDLVFFVHV